MNFAGTYSILVICVLIWEDISVVTANAIHRRVSREEPQEKSSSGSNAGLIAGLIIGGIVLVIIIGGLVYVKRDVCLRMISEYKMPYFRVGKFWKKVEENVYGVLGTSPMSDSDSAYIYNNDPEPQDETESIYAVPDDDPEIASLRQSLKRGSADPVYGNLESRSPNENAEYIYDNDPLELKSEREDSCDNPQLVINKAN